jgi:hypothetical protein
MSSIAKVGYVLACLALAAGVGVLAHAELPPSRCTAVIQFEPYIGDRCMTFKGVVFTLVRDAQTQAIGWRSERTGRVWFELITRGVSQVQAAELCSIIEGQSLPSLEDFIEGDRDGIRDLFPQMRNVTIWSRTALPGDPSRAYYFYGGIGKDAQIGAFTRSSREENSAALCVSL